jgi:hypothetical protein
LDDTEGDTHAMTNLTNQAIEAPTKKTKKEPSPAPPSPALAIERPTQAVSIGGLADMLGVTRQRIYTMVNSGLISIEYTPGGMVIPAVEACRIIDSAVWVVTRRGRHRLFFDFV